MSSGARGQSFVEATTVRHDAASSQRGQGCSWSVMTRSSKIHTPPSRMRSGRTSSASVDRTSPSRMNSTPQMPGSSAMRVVPASVAKRPLRTR